MKASLGYWKEADEDCPTRVTREENRGMKEHQVGAGEGNICQRAEAQGGVMLH